MGLIGLGSSRPVFSNLLPFEAPNISPLFISSMSLFTFTKNTPKTGTDLGVAGRVHKENAFFEFEKESCLEALVVLHLNK